MWGLRSVRCCSESSNPTHCSHWTCFYYVIFPSSVMVSVNPLCAASSSTTGRYRNWGGTLYSLVPPFPHQFPPFPSAPPLPFLTTTDRNQHFHLISSCRKYFCCWYHKEFENNSLLYELSGNTYVRERDWWTGVDGQREPSVLSELWCFPEKSWGTVKEAKQKRQVRMHAKLWRLISMGIMYNFFFSYGLKKTFKSLSNCQKYQFYFLI